MCRKTSFPRLPSSFSNPLRMCFNKCPSNHYELCSYTIHCWNVIGKSYGFGLSLQTLFVYCVYVTLSSIMAPIVRFEPNDIQALLLYDDAIKDLERIGWLVFIRKFQGFNLQVAQEFTFSFDGCREKVGDVQLEVTEDFLS